MNSPSNDPGTRGTRSPARVRAAIYARTAAQDPHQLGRQLHHLRSHAARVGWNVTAEYADQSWRPTSVQTLVERARRSEVDVVLIASADRLGRKVETFRSNLEQLLNTGVRIEWLDGTRLSAPGVVLLTELVGTIADAEGEHWQRRQQAREAFIREHGYDPESTDEQDG